MDITGENQALLGSLVALIRAANALSAHDVGFVRSVSRDLAGRSQAASQDLLGLVNALLEKIDPVGFSVNGRLEDLSDVNRRWRGIEQVFEVALDKAARPPQSAKKLASVNMREIHKQSGNIEKPQLAFARKVDNAPGPFRPLLTDKPFALSKSLDDALTLREPDERHQQPFYDQPYETEIRRAKFPARASVDVIGARPDWDQTPFTLVDTPKKLRKMVAKLEKAAEVAVDVEHHEYRTYLGLVCLVQISANNEDYIVDALALRSEMQILNRVFANPDIVKVLHGARMDVLWLQRDLGLYIVNLLDTFVASQLLGLPKHSLAYLLQRYADFTAQKQYQLADWRVRPLPQELVDYARADTHFLIYVYQQLRHELLERKLWSQAIANSRDVAVKKYEKPGWNLAEPAWLQTALKFRLTGDAQRSCLIALWNWRDATARELDESPRFVMTPQFMANLCIQQPTDTAGVLRASHSISRVVTDRVDEVAKLIADALSPRAIAEARSAAFKNTRPTVADDRFTPVSDESRAQTPLSEQPPAQLKSDVFFDVEVANRAPPDVDLGIIEWKSLEKAQQLQKEQAEEEAEEEASEESEEEPVEKAPSPADSADDQAEQPEPRNVKGRTLNIVSKFDDFDISDRVGSKRSRELSQDPGFDFEAAARAAAEQTGGAHQQKSFSRFKSGNGKVSKIDNRKFKKSKSFRK